MEYFYERFKPKINRMKLSIKKTIYPYVPKRNYNAWIKHIKNQLLKLKTQKL